MPTPLRFGCFELLTAERRLLDRGAPVSLGSRAFDLLVALVENREQVVSKDELLRLVWPGVVVEENNLTVHISTLRKVLGPDALATVVGRGYRFVLPLDAPVADLAPPLPDKPTMAVLPFAHQPGDAAHADFVHGITDEIITRLSRFHALCVTSCHSVSADPHQPVDVRNVARVLGVQYVLEGSVHRAGTQVRVSVALTDATSAHQIWAERYDRPQEDVFVLQDALAQAIVAAIVPHIETSEMGRCRSVGPAQVTAYEIAQRAWARARDGLSRSHHAARDDAIALARQALALDPRSSAAWNAITSAQSWHLYFDTAVSAPVALAEGLDAAAQALAIDCSDHLAYSGRGWLVLVDGRLTEAMADLRRSLELNPNDALTLARLGMCEAVSGDAASGTRRCLEALRLSPRDPSRFHLLANLAWAHFAAGAYADAVAAALQSLRESDFAGARLCLVLSLVGLGDMARASAELQALQRLAPAMVAARLKGVWLATDPAVRQREAAFLHAAQAHTAAL